MRFSTAAAISGLAAVAVAESNGTWSEGPHGGPPSGSWGSSPDVWTTEVVTAFTTYCPEATALTHAGSTYSVTSATTLTITNCPGGCTITKPVSSSVVTVCSTCSATAAPWTSSSVVVPSKPVPSAASAVTSAKASVGTISPYKPSNGTAMGTGKATGTGSWSSSAPASTSGPAPYKGAATKTTFGVAGLIAAFGFVAAL